MRTYLVTGGAGFIGFNYIHYMFKKYGNAIRIINVDKLTYAGNLENLKDIENRENLWMNVVAPLEFLPVPVATGIGRVSFLGHSRQNSPLRCPETGPAHEYRPR